MSTDLNTFHSHAIAIADEESGITAFVFSITGEHILICCKGEVSVELNQQEQTTVRGAESWTMLLISRGMLNPVATLMGEWLCFQQQMRINANISEGLPSPQETETHNSKPDEKQN